MTDNIKTGTFPENTAEVKGWEIVQSDGRDVFVLHLKGGLEGRPVDVRVDPNSVTVLGPSGPDHPIGRVELTLRY